MEFTPHFDFIVPFSFSCDSAQSLEKLRTCALPFDWMQIRWDSILQSLEHQLEFMEDVKHQRYRLDYDATAKEFIAYKAWIPHETLTDLCDLQSKYWYYMQRFLHLLRSGKKICLLCTTKVDLPEGEDP